MFFKASFRKSAWKRLVFIAFVIPACILRFVWNRSSDGSSFLSLASGNKVFVEAGFNIADAVGCCWDVILSNCLS